jgi:transposase
MYIKVRPQTPANCNLGERARAPFRNVRWTKFERQAMLGLKPPDWRRLWGRWCWVSSPGAEGDGFDRESASRWVTEFLENHQSLLSELRQLKVAERFGVARQIVHRWVARYRDSGIDGLADRSHAPKAHPWRISAEVEAVICDLRSSHLRWGPRRPVFELARRGHPDISRSTVYRVLVR